MDDKTDEAMAHLQAAAHEMIKAARAFLDVAEELVTDPRTSETVLKVFDSVADAAGRVRPNRSPDDEDDPLQHIPVS
jgi:hypothetical protein